MTDYDRKLAQEINDSIQLGLCDLAINLMTISENSKELEAILNNIDTIYHKSLRLDEYLK
jgi:hypothetical protein